MKLFKKSKTMVDKVPIEEFTARLESDDYESIATRILQGIGGKDNVISAENCATRLRLEIKNMSLINDSILDSSGALGVVKQGKDNLHIIIGPQVQYVQDAFTKLIIKN